MQRSEAIVRAKKFQQAGFTHNEISRLLSEEGYTGRSGRPIHLSTVWTLLKASVEEAKKREKMTERDNIIEGKIPYREKTQEVEASEPQEVVDDEEHEEIDSEEFHQLNNIVVSITTIVHLSSMNSDEKVEIFKKILEG